MNKRIIARCIYDGDYKRALELLLELVEEQEKQIKELQEKMVVKL